MRTREEIKNEVERKGLVSKLTMLEILLDIRDLLEKFNKKK